MSVDDSATVFSLNKIAAVIWEAADGVTPLDEIVETHICPYFDVAPKAAQYDAEDLVQRLVGHGILLASDRPIAAAESAEDAR